MRPIRGTLLAGVATLVLAGGPSPSLQAADLALINGRIFTQLPSPRTVSAVLVRDGRIAMVGTDREVLAAAGVGTQVIDLGGYVGYPGFHDARSRLGECGPAALEVPLAGLRGRGEVLAALRDSAAATPRDRWLLGREWDPAVARGTAATLDSVSTRVPILLVSGEGRAAWLNRRGLERLRLEPGSHGDGVFHEAAALQVIGQWVGSASVEQVAAAIEQRVNEGLSRGVVTYHDLSPYERAAEALGLLARRKRLKARILELPTPQLPQAEAAWRVAATIDPDRLSLGPAHLMLDAGPGSPVDSAAAWIAPAQLRELAARAAAEGRGMSFAAFGSPAAGNALDLVDSLRLRGARGPWRIEGTDRLDSLAGARARGLGVIWVGFPHRLAGSWRADSAAGGCAGGGIHHPLLSLYRGTGRVALGSDGTPAWMTPFRLVQQALGHPDPREPLPPAACLNGVTTTAAQAAGEEGRSGALAVGSRADIVVLDRDLLRVPPESLPYTRVLLTVSAGEVVHRKEL